MGRPRARVSAGHVIWAYDVHIYDWASKGMTAAQIRARLREECHLHVAVASVKAVLNARSTY